MELKDFCTIFVSVALINNFVLARFLGLCPFIGVSKKTDAALGMGMAVTFVMTLASAVTWLIYHYLLVPENIFYQWGWIPRTNLAPLLKTASYILVIAALVQLVEMFLKKVIPALYRSLGIYLPLITTNCAILGVALLNTTDAPAGALSQQYLIMAVFQGFAAGSGFTVVLLLMSGIRERLEYANVPQCFQGVPIAFICTGMMALAFMGFLGLVASPA